MSQTERPVNVALKTMLVNNEPFQYAHLIKFERPSRPDALSGLVSTSKQRYTYLTDASINVSFDDGSKDLLGTPNGTQLYLANKVLKVGAVQEQTKATASQTSLTLDGNALGASILATVNIASGGTDLWDITFTAPVSLDDVLAQGFREGDKVEITIASVKYVMNIHSFRANNVLRVAKIDTNLVTGSGLVSTMTLTSEEIISILMNKNSTDYSSFINREVFIYKAYFQDGVIIGTPINIFKGIIQNVSFEDTEQGIKVNWGLTSHWGDFSQVRGRITSDEFHRALDENGVPQPQSALKPIYAYDKGFMHSETSVNMLAKYITMVEKIDVKSKKGVLGIGAKVKTKKTFVPEDRFTDLDIQLTAKAIPIIYGVRMAEGIGIFADTLKTDSGTVYIVSALCEGEIGGIYDIYVDGQSLICNDAADFEARSENYTRSSEANDAIEIFCRGRADRGDALGGTSATTGTPYFYYGPNGEQIAINIPILYNFVADYWIDGYTLPTTTSTYNSGSGVLDGETISLTSPQDIVLDVFTGKPGQKASAQLSKIAFDKQFKIQNDYWAGSDTTEYWGPNHRLLDTAYVVGKFKIADGETTIPEIKFIVRGKVIECYNYDYSYLHDRKASGEQADTYADNFPLGSTVTLYRSDTNAVINSNVQIIDKWTFINPDGTKNTRFRFSATPNLIYDDEGKPAITKFYMQNGASQKWTMTTYNHLEFNGTVASAIAATTLVKGSSGGLLTIGYATNTDVTIENDPINATAKFQVVTSTLDPVTTGVLFPSALFTGTMAATSTLLTTGYSATTYSTETIPTGAKLASKNTIKLSGTASITDGFYTGDLIEVTRYNSTTGKSLVQVAEIIGYNGTNRIATIDTIWDFIPNTNDTVKIYPKYTDGRVSINPAIQLLDYITSKTYGRGLDIYKDIDLPSWTLTARKCDARSNVSVGANTPTVAPTAGAIYKYPATGNIIWQGTVSSIVTGRYANRIVTFTDVIGKLTNRWNSWKSYALNELVYHETRTYRVDTAGVKATAPTHTTGTVNGLTYLSSITLTKVSGTGDNLTLPATSGNCVFNEKNGKKISGYSVYDCDDINYWRLSGWDEHSQRYATKHQTNIQIDTSLALFENTNGLLEHFNGILRYTSGKYYLGIEELATTISGQSSSTDVRILTTDDIIGKIQMSDEGVRSAFNSLTAAFADPANKFEARNISFFNSEYLKADRNVPKKGNLSVPGVTNYYNTRLLADSVLNKSRFGLTVSFTVRPLGILLLAGTVIQIIYPRYGTAWTAPGKKFRIESITYQPDGYADIVAKEYDDSFYSLVNIGGGSAGGSVTGGGPPISTVMGNPTNLVVTGGADELLNGVELFWDNDPNASVSNAFTEVYGGLSEKLHVYVSAIDGATDVLTTTTPHGLVPGMPIYPQETTNGLDRAKIYFVLSTPTPSTFTVSESRSGPISQLTTGSGLNIKIRTATLLASLAVPTRSYIDTIVNEGTGRVEKYYWVRHKAIRA